MKVKTSITLSSEVLKQIDEHHRKFRSPSEFLVGAARVVLAHLAKTEAERRDLEIINQNAEAKDVLACQVKLCSDLCPKYIRVLPRNPTFRKTVFPLNF
jgi:Arc/MetJ-type ribon-helix-helix transcriptional regulator